MRKLAFMLPFVVSTIAFALQVGTNEVDFILSQSGVNAGEEPALQQEINRIVGPSSDCAMFYDIGDGCVAFDSYSLPPPLFQKHPFEVGHCVSNRFEIPVVASFASNLVERFLFCESHSSEVASAESFRMALSQAFSETNGSSPKSSDPLRFHWMRPPTSGQVGDTGPPPPSHDPPSFSAMLDPEAQTVSGRSFRCKQVPRCSGYRLSMSMTIGTSRCGITRNRDIAGSRDH